MNLTESKMAIAFANQIDPRVQMNDATAEVWATSLQAHEATKVRWAITQHYATSNANGEGTHAITPARIRRLIHSKAEEVETKQRALEPPRGRTRSIESFRDRNPELWDKLVQEGREQFHAEEANHGD
ncbi:hypothetical protein [Glutamicibacter sp. X7]